MVKEIIKANGLQQLISRMPKYSMKLVYQKLADGDSPSHRLILCGVDSICLSVGFVHD